MQANNQVMTLVMTCDHAAQLIENMQGDAARALLQQANFEHGPMDLKIKMRHLYSMALYKKHNSTLDDLCEGLSDLEGDLQAAQTHGLDQLARQIEHVFTQQSPMLPLVSKVVSSQMFVAPSSQHNGN